jgi:Cu-processing system permease protein
MAIGLWLFFVLVFDLLVLGALVISGGGVGGDVVPYVLLLNPADVFRILNIVSLDEVRTLYGLATVFPDALTSPVALTLVMAGWIAAPIAVASWRFRR